MKACVLAAGWPFAGLLALDTDRAEVSGAAPVQGLIVENDDQSGILVLESGEAFGPPATGATARFYGVDGYPIASGDIRVGDTVKAVQEKIGAGWVTTKVRVLPLAPRTSSASR